MTSALPFIDVLPVAVKPPTTKTLCVIPVDPIVTPSYASKVELPIDVKYAPVAIFPIP